VTSNLFTPVNPLSLGYLAYISLFQNLAPKQEHIKRKLVKYGDFCQRGSPVRCNAQQLRGTGPRVPAFRLELPAPGHGGGTGTRRPVGKGKIYILLIIN
jgi:hypothetical protein